MRFLFELPHYKSHLKQHIKNEACVTLISQFNSITIVFEEELQAKPRVCTFCSRAAPPNLSPSIIKTLLSNIEKKITTKIIIMIITFSHNSQFVGLVGCQFRPGVPQSLEYTHS